MGASGAGKTTLLNTLAGRYTITRDKEITGEIKYNGKVLEYDQISNSVGFVMQNDIFIEELTPQGFFSK